MKEVVGGGGRGEMVSDGREGVARVDVPGVVGGAVTTTGRTGIAPGEGGVGGSPGRAGGTLEEGVASNCEVER